MATQLNIPMTPVQSSNLTARGYDAQSQTLQLTFRGDSTYRYADVPGSVYEGLVKAESAGRYVAAEIKGKFKATKVEKPKS